jgi:signal transduction histidine kinase
MLFSRPSSPQHPLRFLLYLEWVLLATVLVSEVVGNSPFQVPRWPGLNLVGLSVFAVMGLRLPDRHGSRLVYTVAELGIVLLLSFGGGVRLFYLLYLVVIIRNCLIFEGWVRSSTSVLAFLLCIGVQTYRFQTLPLLPAIVPPDQLALIWWSLTLLLGLVVLCLQLLVNAVLAERRSRDRLAEANAQLRHYALRIEDLATVQERNRIAREIHDSLGHSLTVFNLHLEAGLRLLNSDPTEARELLTEAKQISAQVLQAVRQSVAALRSDPLQGRSLPEAVAVLAADCQRSLGFAPVCTFAIDQPLGAEVKTAAYRIVQEALTNICKSAIATRVEIELCTSPTQCQVRVQDDGQGFDPQQTTTGFGLQGMQERTLALSGTLELITAPGAGCCIIATFPLGRLTA